MNKVLILGAGLVAKPLVEYLLENGFRLLIATRSKERADSMINGNPQGTSIKWTMDDPHTLERIIAESNITVSLLPYKYHVDIALACLRHGKSLITTSYVQSGMLALDEASKSAGVLFLNEIGLDPGIDHMSAMRIIDHIHDDGGKVDEFYSFCGALPAPEAADNPLKYKFSWSPKGVILASINNACYLKNGRKVFIEAEKLFSDRFNYFFPGIGDLDVYPNRDSTIYIDFYKIPETKTLYRGTFRFKGWCDALDAMKRLNMLEDTIKKYPGKSYAEFLAERNGLEVYNLKKNIALLLGIPEESQPIESLDYLGFFSDEILQYNETTPFEITSDRMINRMLLTDNERDMVLLQHLILASYKNGKREVIKSSMQYFGSPSTNTSIARTVGLPAAVAVKLILQKKIDLKGVYRPVVPEIYNPVLDELKNLGIEMKEEYGLPESEMIN